MLRTSCHEEEGKHPALGAYLKHWPPSYCSDSNKDKELEEGMGIELGTIDVARKGIACVPCHVNTTKSNIVVASLP